MENGLELYRAIKYLIYKHNAIFCSQKDYENFIAELTDILRI